MLRLFKRSAAVLCTAALAFSLSGCADTTWVAKLNNESIPTGMYLKFLVDAHDIVSYYAQNASSTVSDPWSMTLGSTSAETWAINYSMESTKQYVMVEQLCKKRNITLTSAEQSTAQKSAESAMSNNNAYEKNGISKASVQRIYADESLATKLFNSYYTGKGEKAVSDADLKSYYASNYVKIKHIVLLTVDNSGNALTTDKVAEVKKKADGILAKAKAAPATFDSLMTQYNQDKDSTTGKQNSPTGYIFSKATAENAGYDSTFTSTALSMKVGEIQEIKTSYGYDIMLKIKVDENYDYFSTNKSSILGAMKGTDFQTTIANAVKSAKFEENKAAINHYNPRKLKAATASSAS